ncbi:MAG TPA: FecR domain-containing protein [Gemmatimonadaceae bacterium]
MRRYLMTRPDVAVRLSAFLRQLDGEEGRPAAPDAEASWGLVRGRMREPRFDQGPVPFRPVTPVRPSVAARHLFVLLPRGGVSRWRRAAIASCVAAGLVAAGVYRVVRHGEVAVDTRPDETFVTANRERAELRLSDGTRIHLAPASRLRVAAAYGETRRDVYLEGQAYFEVEHDGRRPFSVHAGNATARDLGTEFAVRSYQDDEAVQVVVRKGAVVLSQVGRLGAGDVGRLGTNGTTSLTHHVRVDSILGWLDGRLAFHDAPLSTVLRELRRWHDTEVELTDPALGTLPFTGVLTDASFRTSIGVVAATLGLRVRHVHDRVVLERIGGLTPVSRARLNPPPS